LRNWVGRRSLSLRDLFLADSGFGRLETKFGMSSITKWFVGARSTAAQRKRRLACQVPFTAFSVHQFDYTFDAIGTVRLYGDLYVSHELVSLLPKCTCHARI